MKKSGNYRNEIKAYIVRAGMTMTDVVELLSKQEKSRALLLLDLFIVPYDSESVPERPLRKPRRMEYFSTLKHPVLRL